MIIWVLDNIVQYASKAMRTILLAKVDHTRTDYLVQAEQLAHFAQAYELHTGRERTLGREKVSTREVVNSIRSTTQGNAKLSLLSRSWTFAGSVSQTQATTRTSNKFVACCE